MCSPVVAEPLAGLVWTRLRVKHLGLGERGERMANVARAETVGSLLRPPEVLEARQQKQAGTIGDAELRAV